MVKKSFEDKIKSNKKKANLRVMDMLNCLKNQEKKSEPIECKNPDLANFQNTPHIKEVCYKFYGEAKGPQCTQRKSFCPMCCKHYIGIKHIKDQIDCKQTCENIILAKN